MSGQQSGSAIATVGIHPHVRTITVDPDRAEDYLARRILTLCILEDSMIRTVRMRSMDKNKEDISKDVSKSDQPVNKISDDNLGSGSKAAKGKETTEGAVTMESPDCKAVTTVNTDCQHSPTEQVGVETTNTSPTETGRRQIIDPKDRGDSGVISDAINSVYALLYENKYAINSHREYNEEQHDKDIGLLRTGKASKQEIKIIDSKISSLRTELEDKLCRSEREKQRCLDLLSS